jgi:type I restriction enzyme S subunit
MNGCSEVILGDVAEIASGGGAPQDANDFGEDGSPFVRAGSLKGLLAGNGAEHLEHLTPEVAAKHKLKLFPVDTILFAKSGMSASIGLVHRLKWPAYVVNHLAAVVCGEKLYSRFLHHYLRVFSPARLIQDAAYPSIRLSDIAALKISLPPLSEQRRIAALLDQADALRVKRREALAQLDSLAQSIFIEMFGDPSKNLNGTKVEPLGEYLYFLTSGGRGWAEYYSESGSRFIRSLDVQMNHIGSENIVFVNAPENAEARRTLVKGGDVLLTITGSLIGRVAAVPDDLAGAYISQHVAILRVNQERIDPNFLSHFLSFDLGGQRQIAKAQYGQTKPGLNFEQIRRFLVPVPPIELQHEFTKKVSFVDKLKATYLAGLMEHDALFTSLQHRAFRGEL